MQNVNVPFVVTNNEEELLSIGNDYETVSPETGRS